MLWRPRTPEDQKFLGLKMGTVKVDRSELIKITVFRCSRCGFLKPYARIQLGGSQAIIVALVRDGGVEPKVSHRPVDLIHLFIQRPQIEKPAKSQKPTGQKIDDSRSPLPHVKPVDSQQSEERQQYPSQGVVERACLIADVRRSVHAGDQDQIDQPTDAQQTEREEPNGPRDLFAVIKPVRAGETEQPQDVAD
jgi:hypothetical protein